jgi:ribosome-binding ATPase YchF (GTP1/OBG family)
MNFIDLFRAPAPKPDLGRPLEDIAWLNKEITAAQLAIEKASHRIPGISRSASTAIARAAKKGKHNKVVAVARDHMEEAFGLFDEPAKRLECATTAVLGISRDQCESAFAFINRIVATASTTEGVLAALERKHQQDKEASA